MESSDEDDNFPSHDRIIPQSGISAIFQSNTEKGIRRLCCELLDLKYSVENLHGNTQTKFLAFLRISNEVTEMEHELLELQKHISAQRNIVQDLLGGMCRELDKWKQLNDHNSRAKDESKIFEPQILLQNEAVISFRETMDNIETFLAEHKVDEALSVLGDEDKWVSEMKSSEGPPMEASTWEVAFSKWKEILEHQLLDVARQPLVAISELRMAISGLIKLGKGPLAHQLLLKSCQVRLKNSVNAFFPSCSLCPKTYSVTLSKLVFSMISFLSKESDVIFGDNPVYNNRVIQWAESELEHYVRLVKENAPSSETFLGLRAACVCVQCSISYAKLLEAQGLKFSELLMVLLRPYIDEVIDLNFQRAARIVFNVEGREEDLSLSNHFTPAFSMFAEISDPRVTDSGLNFLSIVKDIVDQMTPLAISKFGGSILLNILLLFDRYLDALMKVLPGPSEDDSLVELKDQIYFRSETVEQQLAVIGIAYTVAEGLSPELLCGFWTKQGGYEELKNGVSEIFAPTSNTLLEYKEWRRRLLHACDNLRDHFCRQFVLNFIYSSDGKTRLDAKIYVNGKAEHLFWGSGPLPSQPLQALFSKLQQLTTVAVAVLAGKEKMQKALLARLTETVVIWLLDEREFWSVFEDESIPLRPSGLQQLILDMHFVVEIARFAGYPSRHIHQIASSIIARAIRAFSARGVDPSTALREDEQFVEAAKAAISRLLVLASASDISETDEENVIIHEEIISGSGGSPSSLSSFESFASASMGELECPAFSDSDGEGAAIPSAYDDDKPLSVSPSDYDF